jgi:hypothetical protein
MEKEYESYIEGMKDGIKAERDGVVHKEFNLSEKIYEDFDMTPLLDAHHVKEFIKLLKAEIKSDIKTKWSEEIMIIIDKLAGDKLI